jgi:hypothetical protein
LVGQQEQEKPLRLLTLKSSEWMVNMLTREEVTPDVSQILLDGIDEIIKVLNKPYVLLPLLSDKGIVTPYKEILDRRERINEILSQKIKEIKHLTDPIEVC